MNSTCPENRKECVGFHPCVPGCGGLEVEHDDRTFRPASALRETGLALQLFEMGRSLIEKNAITFRVSGTCMLPLVRPGDVLHIVPKRARDIDIGEIAVFRRDGRLFCHRTVARGSEGDAWYIVTRPDTAVHGDDGPVFDENILGTVRNLERKGKTLETEQIRSSWPQKLYYRGVRRIHGFRGVLKDKASVSLERVQHRKAYRIVGGFLYRRSGRNAGVSRTVPWKGGAGSRFQRKVTTEELIRMHQGVNPGRPARFSLHLTCDTKPAATLLFLLRPDGCPFSGWWLARAEVRVRYRGSAVEKRLLREMDALFLRLGVSSVRTTCFEKDPGGRGMLEELGFRETPFPGSPRDGREGAARTGCTILERRFG